MKDRYSEGMITRRRVLGDAYVDRAEANKTDFDQPIQTLITEGHGARFGQTTQFRAATGQC